MSLIDLSNSSVHPTQTNYLVFRYPTVAEAQEMVDLLAAKGIKSQADLLEGPPFMVGVPKRYASVAEGLNYRALGKNRKPMISNPFWRWALIAFFVATMTIAIIGYIKA